MEKDLLRFGVHPYQNNRSSNITLLIIIMFGLTAICPTWKQLYNGIRHKDMDELIENLPQIITSSGFIIKLLNIRTNKTRFRNLFEIIGNGWSDLKTKNELHMLEAFTKQGSRLATFYSRTLITFLILFLCLPLINPVMDVFKPLNESRELHHIFKIDYMIIDDQKHFYPIYIHLSVCTTFVVYAIVTADTMYITIIHHACGLFAVCGNRIQKKTEQYSLQESTKITVENAYEEFKHCVKIHHEAILFHDTLDKCCRKMYLIAILLNMLGISLTAVEAVIYLHKPNEFIRACLFLISQNFHLFVISLPGQVLLDQSLNVGNQIYTSKWYETPVNVQQMLYTMQIRSSKSCMLTAGGIYEMKIESFGATINACMSYITMFLSVRE